MDENEMPATCGQGIAANAVLPAKLGEFAAGMAEVLSRHRAALDAGDADSKAEDEAYAKLAASWRAVSDDLATLAAEMTACRDLPDGTHDIAALTGPGGQAEAYERFLGVQSELAALLNSRIEATR